MRPVSQMDGFSTDARILQTRNFSSFKIVFQARFKAPKTNQVRAEIYCDLNTGSFITHISGEERRGIGSCRCAILLGDVLMCELD